MKEWFQLPFGGMMDRLSGKWERKISNQRAQRLMRLGPTGVVDSGATSTCGATNGPFEATGKQSEKVFALPTGRTVCATEKKKLMHNLQDPARDVDIVPGMKKNINQRGKIRRRKLCHCLCQRWSQNLRHKHYKHHWDKWEGYFIGLAWLGKWWTVLHPTPPTSVKQKQRHHSSHKRANRAPRPMPTRNCTSHQHCVQTPQHQKSNPIPTCSSRIPHQSNIAESHLSRTLRILTCPQCLHSQQIFPTIRQNAKGHMRETKEGVRSTKTKIKWEHTTPTTK